MKLHVVITPKEEVIDAAGDAIKERMVALGFSEVQSVRLGKVIEIDISAADRDNAISRIKQMCGQLLVNARIEDFQIKDIEEA